MKINILMTIILIFNLGFDIITNRINKIWGQKIGFSYNENKRASTGCSFRVVFGTLSEIPSLNLRFKLFNHQ